MPQPIRICTSQEMRALDAQAEREYGIDARILMENAGRAATQVILEQYPEAGRATEVLVFAGKGNNAGDAFVVARRLICLERRVRVFHLEQPTRYSGATAANFEILKKMKAKLTWIEGNRDLEAFFQSSPGPFSVVDGILGTGLKGNLEGLFFDLVELLNRPDIHSTVRETIALDIPTGVCGDSGRIAGTSLHADLTVSFGFPKLGHFLPPGAARRGELINVDISLPPVFKKTGDQFLITPTPLSSLLKERDRYGHKNSFGHTLLLGGSPGRLGAIAMAARACHRVGTGLVTVGTWPESLDLLTTKLPNESMAAPIALSGPEFEAYRKASVNYTSVVLGPGLGSRKENRGLLEEMISHYAGPLVLDADGLNVLAEYQMHDRLKHRQAPTVLTPHVGEMARLLGWEKSKVIEQPIEALKRAVDATHAIVLLKGAATLISSPDERVYLNHYPNDGMATAGSGDVLAGIIGGLLGQKMDPFQATLLGVYLHSLAGGFAARELGHRSMTAQDIIENLTHAFKEIRSTAESVLPMEGRVHLL